MHGHQRIELIVNDTEYTSVLVVDDQIVKLIVYARKQTIFQRFVKVCKHLNKIKNSPARKGRGDHIYLVFKCFKTKGKINALLFVLCEIISDEIII